MRNRLFTLACEVILMLAIAGLVLAQDKGGQPSASAASANPYAAIDRPGTRSPYERSGVDSGTAAAGPASA